MKGTFASPVSRPNVLFILTDDQRWDALGAIGNPHIRTPNLDALASRGILFTAAHIPGGTSGAICMPSRAMLHTGRSLFRIHGAGEEIPSDHLTLGECFRKAGYQTFGTGKWHNGRASYHRSFEAGDEIFFGGMADHWNVPAYHYDPTGRYDKTCLMTPRPMESNETVARPCDHIHAGRHSTDIIAEATVRFLEEQRDSRPFFAYVAFLAPHDPRTMPARYRALYDPDALPLPPNFLPEHPFDNGDLDVRDERLAPRPRTPEVVRRHLADYYAMISHLDDRIGDILAALDRTGERERTLVVVTGDNGLALGCHGLFGKQNLYEHSIRVPLLVAGPGLPCGIRDDRLCYLFDLFPTLCRWTGLSLPSSLEGVSLFDSRGAGSDPSRHVLYLVYRESQRGVKTDRYKLIEYVVGGQRTMTQLFDLMEDPHEIRNRAEDPGLRKVLASLRATLFQLRDEWGDRETRWGQQFWNGYEKTGE